MACRDLCAREPKFSADILAPIAHEVRLCGESPFRQKGPTEIAETQPLAIAFPIRHPALFNHRAS